MGLWECAGWWGTCHPSCAWDKFLNVVRNLVVGERDPFPQYFQYFGTGCYCFVRRDLMDRRVIVLEHQV